MVKQGIITIGVIIVAAIVVLVTFRFLLPFLGYGGAAAKEQDETVAVEEVKEDPKVYDGLVVDIEGTVADWVTRRAFAIEGDQKGFLSSASVLVVAENDFKLPADTPDDTLALGDNEKVRVRGKVRIFTREELLERFGEGDEDSDITQWADQPVIIANSIEKL